MLLTNTPSLYSMLMYSKGITDSDIFLKESRNMMRVFMSADGIAPFFNRFIETYSTKAAYIKFSNRAVNLSMEELISRAKFYLEFEEMSIFDVSFELNKIQMPLIKHIYPEARPRGVFMGLRYGGLLS
jgi:hypothetical protein